MAAKKNANGKGGLKSQDEQVRTTKNLYGVPMYRRTVKVSGQDSPADQIRTTLRMRREKREGAELLEEASRLSAADKKRAAKRRRNKVGKALSE